MLSHADPPSPSGCKTSYLHPVSPNVNHAQTTARAKAFRGRRSAGCLKKERRRSMVAILKPLFDLRFKKRGFFDELFLHCY